MLLALILTVLVVSLILLLSKKSTKSSSASIQSELKVVEEKPVVLTEKVKTPVKKAAKSIKPKPKSKTKKK